MPKVSNFDNFKLNESLDSFKHLAGSKIWKAGSDKEISLDRSVHNKLIRIAHNFWDSISPLFGGKEIEDIQISGDLGDLIDPLSPDIDLYIIFDKDGLEEEEFNRLSREFEKQKFQMNLDRPKKVRGLGIDLFLNDKDSQHSDSGLYSLIKNKWISNPKASESIDNRDVEKKYYSLGNAIETIVSKLSTDHCSDHSRKKLLEKASFLKKKIQKMRSSSLDDSKSYCISSRAYKKLKNEGYINKLIRILP